MFGERYSMASLEDICAANQQPRCGLVRASPSRVREILLRSSFHNTSTSPCRPDYSCSVAHRRLSRSNPTSQLLHSYTLSSSSIDRRRSYPISQTPRARTTSAYGSVEVLQAATVKRLEEVTKVKNSTAKYRRASMAGRHQIGL
jgi:hypothetical protein